MADLIAELKKVQKEAASLQRQVPPVRTTHVDPKNWGELVARAAAAYPELAVDTNAVIKAGANAAGQPVMLACLKRPKDASRNQPSGVIQIYSSGSVTWTNLEPV